MNVHRHLVANLQTRWMSSTRKWAAAYNVVVQSHEAQPKEPAAQLLMVSCTMAYIKRAAVLHEQATVHCCAFVLVMQGMRR